MGTLIRSVAPLIVLIHLFSCRSARGQERFSEGDLIGDWLVSEKTAVITFFKNGDKYYGYTSWMNRPKDEHGKPRTDIKNPDPKKRNKPLLGAVLCQNFTYDGKGVWVNGTVYDSRSGKTYNAKITMKDKNTIVLRGYIGISLIGGSTTWTRKHK